MATIRGVLELAARQLVDAQIDNAKREAEILLEFLFNRDRAWLHSHSEELFPKHMAHKLEKLLYQRIVERKPLAYIFGYHQFLNLKLKVNSSVLIPRPETETLVELTSELINRQDLRNGHFLDVGTGSGAIAIALKKNFPSATVWASDNSAAGLKVTRQNCASNNAKLRLIKSDLLSNVPLRPLDIVIANLPYVAEDDWSGIGIEIRRWEPKDAIVSGDNGLDAINTLISQTANYLKPSGWLILEIGDRQTTLIKQQIAYLWPKASFEVKNDLANRPRFVFVSPVASRLALASG